MLYFWLPARYSHNRIDRFNLRLSSGYVVRLEKIFGKERAFLITGMLLFGHC